MMGKRLVLSAVCLWGSLMSVFSQDAKVFDADSFNVAVTYMMPVSYPARTLSYGYGVALRNDSAFVYLPYMGRVYQPTTVCVSPFRRRMSRPVTWATRGSVWSSACARCR